jgi:teichuronic acid biosynthesis glycosyltransferase TuaC
MNVAVVAEYYPRRADPALGVWAHRQALAARDAGADVRVLVLHRLVPPRAALAARDARALAAPLRQPLRDDVDGLDVTYVPFVSPPFDARAYPRWGTWAAPPLAIALHALRRRRRVDLVHAHYAVPAADAVLRAGAGAPLLVSVHGGDVLWTARHTERGAATVARALSAATLVLANSAGTARRCALLGAEATRVVHLGTDLPSERPALRPEPTVVTVGHLVARKRHAAVIRAVAELPGVRYLVVGDGPERAALEALARDLGVADRVELAGALPPREATAAAHRCHVFAMPSVDEAFGVAYVEAMAGWVPAVGLRGEDGPEEIAAAGGGMVLAEPDGVRDAIATALDGRDRLADEARATVVRHFTWERCGAETVAAYQAATAGGKRPRSAPSVDSIGLSPTESTVGARNPPRRPEP